jgi:hypothetical protein
MAASMMTATQKIIGQSLEGLPRSRFHCVLDEQPSYLVPTRLLAEWRAVDDSAEIEANPFCWLSPTGFLPASVAGRAPHVDGLALPHSIIWVDDPVKAVLSPFWLGQRFEALLAGLEPGRPARAERLSVRDRAVLRAAGVLVTSEKIAQGGAEMTEMLSRAACAFTRGYAMLGGLIHPFHIGALRRYYRYMIRQGAFVLGDGQSPRRYAIHNDAVARFFHHQLAGVMSQVAGVPVKPSYVYLASYQSGAELRRHTDREQCEYSITLLVDHSPEPVRESPWPIVLHGKEAVVTVHQSIGDALLYRGRQIPHSRGRLPDGFTSTSLLFHYVDEKFEGPLH